MVSLSWVSSSTVTTCVTHIADSGTVRFLCPGPWCDDGAIYWMQEELVSWPEMLWIHDFKNVWGVPAKIPEDIASNLILCHRLPVQKCHSKKEGTLLVCHAKTSQQNPTKFHLHKPETWLRDDVTGCEKRFHMTSDVHTPLQTIYHHALVQFFTFVPFSSELHENGETQRVQPHVQFVLKGWKKKKRLIKNLITLSVQPTT